MKSRPGRAKKSAVPGHPPESRHSFTLGEVARAVGGTVAGDAKLRLTGVESLERAGPQDLSFVADEKRAARAGASRAGAVLATSLADAGGKPAVLVAVPVLALAAWLERVHPRRPIPPGAARGARVHPSAHLSLGVAIAAGATVAAGARVGARTVIEPGAYVGEEAQIGEDCHLFPNTVVLERCRVGNRCVLHAGAVVGSDGFGYVWDGARHRKIPQVGTVRIEDDVEIGANAAIDRATLGETVIGRGTKIDNLVQIGHNVVVGPDSLLCGQAGIAGSARLGRGVVLAGQVGISDHAEVGDGAIVTGQGGVVRGSRIPAGATVSGMPALPHREFLRRAAVVGRLPELIQRVAALEQALASAKGE